MKTTNLRETKTPQFIPELHTVYSLLLVSGELFQDSYWPLWHCFVSYQAMVLGWKDPAIGFAPFRILSHNIHIGWMSPFTFSTFFLILFLGSWKGLQLPKLPYLERERHSRKGMFMLKIATKPGFLYLHICMLLYYNESEWLIKSGMVPTRADWA